jgi:hypothetical protein
MNRASHIRASLGNDMAYDDSWADTVGKGSGREWRTNNEEAKENEPKVSLVTRDPVGHTLFLTGIVGQYT